LLIGTAFHFGKEVPFSEQWPLFEALRTTASIIFAVIGAWLAIIYPERLRLSFKNADSTPETNGYGVSKLFTPIVHSTAILCVILIFGVVAPLLKRMEWLEIHVDLMRGLSYALLAILTLWQLWTVVLTLIPADLIKSQADHDHRKAKTVKGFMGKGGFQGSEDAKKSEGETEPTESR
tara:strand:+ start:146 stop:679 length:534 start_codon:yes stop_codon:yes gene_type:complete